MCLLLISPLSDPKFFPGDPFAPAGFHERNEDRQKETEMPGTGNRRTFFASSLWLTAMQQSIRNPFLCCCWKRRIDYFGGGRGFFRLGLLFSLFSTSHHGNWVWRRSLFLVFFSSSFWQNRSVHSLVRVLRKKQFPTLFTSRINWPKVAGLCKLPAFEILDCKNSRTATFAVECKKMYNLLYAQKKR